MNFMDAVEHVFTHYAVFEGRARRSEFWYFQLFHFVVVFVLGALSFTGFLATLLGLYMLASLIPNIAVCWRRFHDIGKSGAWYFISFIPIVGLVLMIIWLSQDSQPGANQYGPNPKGIGNYAGGRKAGNTYASGQSQGCLAVQCLSGPCRDRRIPSGEMRSCLAEKRYVPSGCPTVRRESAEDIAVSGGSRGCRC